VHNPYHTVTDPELMSLKRDLRRAILMLDAVPTYQGKPWSAITRYQKSMREGYAGPVRVLKRRIAARRKQLNLGPAPKLPTVKIPSWVNRLKAQYHDEAATAEMFATWCGNVGTEVARAA
jgi:hypothetical protein